MVRERIQVASERNYPLERVLAAVPSEDEEVRGRARARTRVDGGTTGYPAGNRASVFEGRPYLMGGFTEQVWL